MDRRQRLEAALASARPDRIPVSAWGHHVVEETDPARFVEATLAFRERYDWDFLKIHSRASYHVEGWGFEFTPSTDPARGHVCTGHPIRDSRDWRRLRPLGLDTPALVEQLTVLDAIRERVPRDCPLIFTVFSPLDVAEKLIDRDSALMKRYIESDPESLEVALAVIAETFARFVGEVAAHGADGIYFSTKWANDEKLPPGLYERLVRPWDLQVLEAARPLWANIVHLCEDHIQIEATEGYPVQLRHWDRHAGHNPDYASARRSGAGHGGAFGGGVDATTLANGDVTAIRAKARQSITEAGGTGFVLGPGCSVQMAKTPERNLRALRDAVND